VKIRGLSHFASDPPPDTAFLVARLWDKRLPAWRTRNQERKELSKDLQQTLLDMLNRIDRDSRSTDTRERITMAETDFIQIKRQVLRKKGKWNRFGPDVK
jgi:hypothetical protein